MSMTKKMTCEEAVKELKSKLGLYDWYEECEKKNMRTVAPFNREAVRTLLAGYEAAANERDALRELTRKAVDEYIKDDGTPGFAPPCAICKHKPFLWDDDGSCRGCNLQISWEWNRRGPDPDGEGERG